MKRFLTILIGIMMLMGFTACSKESGNADKGNDGIIEDAGNAVDDVLDGAENVVDDVTGSSGGNTSKTEQGVKKSN